MKKPEDYLEAVLFLVTTPDAFSRREAEALLADAALCLREIFGHGQRSTMLMQSVLAYVYARQDEVEHAKAIQGQARDDEEKT